MLPSLPFGSRFAISILLAIAVLASCETCGAQSSLPNIVIILADDLGYGDVNLRLSDAGAFANPIIRTPNLAKLASQSIVFRHHYAAAPVCSPSRAGLLTGRTPTRCNIDLYINDLKDNERRFLAGPEITIAEIAKQAGYETAVFGKWHLNGADWEQPSSWVSWTGSFPRQQGFDEGWVTKENAHFTRHLQVNTQRNPGDIFGVDGQPKGTVKGYTSDLITDSAVDWLENRQGTGKPFLMYLPYDAVHIRISSPDSFERMYDTGDPRTDIYYAIVSHLDAAIGRFLEALDRLQLSEDTLVIFTSDNGPDVLDKWDGTSFCMGTSYPLRGQKYQLTEGGIRVPGMVRWPGRIEPRLSDEPNSAVDLLPTICELVGIPIPQDRAIDGASMLGHLVDGHAIQRQVPLYWQFEHPVHFETIGQGYQRRENGLRQLNAPAANIAIRWNNYILHGLQRKPYEPPQEFALYDVAADPELQVNILDQQPARYEELRNRLLEMHASVARDREKTIQFIETKGQSHP